MPCVLHVSVTVSLIVFDIISLNKVFVDICLKMLVCMELRMFYNACAMKVFMFALVLLSFFSGMYCYVFYL